MTLVRVVVAALAIVPCLALVAGSPVREGTPPARAHHALAYDPATRRVMLTGGSTPRDSGRAFEFFNDLWAFDGRRWVERSGVVEAFAASDRAMNWASVSPV